MKNIFAAFLLFLTVSSCSSSKKFTALLEEGKAEFSKEFEQQDFTVSVDKLKKAVRMKPDHAEARYFLGYAYSRLNSQDGSSMINMRLDLTEKASEQFERVIQLEPRYTGEMLLLDPYSKLTSEWGAQAMSFLHNNHADSALWAFREGKARGGFGDFPLALQRLLLDDCAPNSILMSSGDLFTIPLWYLQVVEGYRRDVSVIDVSLLNAPWYPVFLSEKGVVRFDLSPGELETIDYCEWSDTEVTAGDLTWTLAPTYYGVYLLRGDRIFLSMLQANQFEREVYFTAGFNPDSKLSLQEHMTSMILAQRLNHDGRPGLSEEEYYRKLSDILILIDLLDMNSPDQISLLKMIRFDIFVRMHQCLMKNDKENARRLLELMDRSIDPNKFPIDSDYENELLQYIRDSV